MKRNTNSVSDSIRPYLDEISERLWNGRATVMIGAGFSKNAGPQFPDWNQLGDLFYEKAYGHKPDSKKDKYLNVLHLAEEVDAAIGRSALEEFIQSNIPDLSCEPSVLHVKLLELPWVDVFTTNYDTLLERASARVMTRKYEPVVNKEDIPYAIKPRIIKLHGSFPFEHPFIITEEDYRRYPSDYAPFVNTVQQSLLENTFCLIGFSGDDPNFLKWIGWIRDNLDKDNTQKIYLIGVFDLSTARKSLLAQRGINVVDFSCCDGIDKDDHKKALERFIEYIQSKKLNDLDWPYNQSKISPNLVNDRNNEIQEITQEWKKLRYMYPGWLILPHTNRENLWTYTKSWGNFLPNIESSKAGIDIEYIYEMVWRIERCLFPINNVAEFCTKILEKYWPFKTGTPSQKCQYCFGEKKSQGLPWDDIREAWLTIALSMLRYYREKGQIDEWEKVENQIKTLYEYLSAEQKAFFNYEGFLFYLFKLDINEARQRIENWDPAVSQPYWMTKHAAAVAEICLSSNFEEQLKLSLLETRKKPNNTVYTPVYKNVSYEAYQLFLLRIGGKNYPIFDNQQSSLEEESLVKERLKQNWKMEKKEQEKEQEQEKESFCLRNQQIKSTVQHDTFDQYWEDIKSKKHEDKPKEFHDILRDIRNEERSRVIKQQNARWDELKSLRCDPWNELKMFELSLVRPCKDKGNITTKPEFDIGQITRTIHIGRTDPDILKAISYLRFCEEVGLPFCIGQYSIASNIAKATLQRISKYSYFWATATLERIGDEKSVDNIFYREYIYKLTTDIADRIIINYLGVLKQFRFQLRVTSQNGNYGIRLAQLLPEVISRLCCKCSSDVKKSVFGFIQEIYASPDKAYYRNIRNLMKRLICSMSEVEQYSKIPDLLEISFPDDLKAFNKNDFQNPLRFLEISRKPDGVSGLDIQQETIDVLCDQASSDDPDMRRWAVSSLITLLNFKLINEHQIEKVSQSLWFKGDKDGFPDGTDYYKFAFLAHPHPKKVNPNTLFKNYVNNTPFPIQKKGLQEGVAMMGGSIPVVYEILGSNSIDPNFWTADEAIAVFQRVKDWWDADKDKLRKTDSGPNDFLSIRNEFESRFYCMMELVIEVICPKLSKESSDNTLKEVERLIKETTEYGLHTLEFEAACLHVFPEKESDVKERIHEALISKKDNKEKDALNALSKMIFSKNCKEENSAKIEAVKMLSQFVMWCSTNVIGSALWIIYRIVKDSPMNYSFCLEEATIKRLEILLEETNYENKKNLITFEEKLEVRRISSILASTLWKHYISKSEQIPEVIVDWSRTCMSTNEFSEISNTWEGCQAI